MRIEKLQAYIFILGSFILFTPLLSAQHDNRSEFKWYGFNEAGELAAETDKQLFLFFEAEWCGYCKQMREEVFPDSIIQNLMSEHFYPVSIDIESKAVITYKGKERSERSFSHLMRINATPTIIFMNIAGEPVGKKMGFTDISEMEKLLIYVSEGYIGHMEFEEFKNRAASANTGRNQY